METHADACRARLDDPFSATHAVCILDRYHTSPDHWGPTRDGERYVQWPRSDWTPRS